MQKQESVHNSYEDSFYRFQVYQGRIDEGGKILKTKSIGMAYLRDGQHMITLRLWTFINERFYLISRQDDVSKYLLMTRELNRSSENKNKYFWNIIGSGAIDTTQNVIRVEFDLFEKPIFINAFPESTLHSRHLPKPDFLMEVA